MIPSIQSIELKLNQHLNLLLYKDDLSSDEINFLIYMLNRAEMKKAQEDNKVDMEKKNENWKNTMKAIMEGVF